MRSAVCRHLLPGVKACSVAHLSRHLDSQMWMKTAKLGEKFDTAKIPPEAFDRQEIIVLMFEAPGSQKQKFQPDVRSTLACLRHEIKTSFWNGHMAGETLAMVGSARLFKKLNAKIELIVKRRRIKPRRANGVHSSHSSHWE